MKPRIFQKILEDLADEYNFVVRSYSGRNMYGKECLAIVGNDIDMFMLGSQIATYGFFDYRCDKMGLGTVYYWKQIEYTEPKENDDGEEDEEE